MGYGDLRTCGVMPWRTRVLASLHLRGLGRHVFLGLCVPKSEMNCPRDHCYIKPAGNFDGRAMSSLSAKGVRIFYNSANGLFIPIRSPPAHLIDKDWL